MLNKGYLQVQNVLNLTVGQVYHEIVLSLPKVRAKFPLTFPKFDVYNNVLKFS